MPSLSRSLHSHSVTLPQPVRDLPDPVQGVVGAAEGDEVDLAARLDRRQGRPGRGEVARRHGHDLLRRLTVRSPETPSENAAMSSRDALTGEHKCVICYV